MGERRDEIWAMMSWTLCDFRSPMHLDRPDNIRAQMEKKSGKIKQILHLGAAILTIQNDIVLSFGNNFET